jgi:DNA-binding XRE family transcriptional regulator
MNDRQCAMARAALKWSRRDLAKAAQVAELTVARLESGRPVADVTRTKIRLAFEKKRVKFLDDGPWKGAVVGPLGPALGGIRVQRATDELDRDT